MARFVTIQQAMRMMQEFKASLVQRRESTLRNHDGFGFNTPSQVQAEYERRVNNYVSGDDDFPEFE